MQQAAPDEETVLATMVPSQPRRVIGAGTLSALGVLLIYLALWHPPSALLWQVFLLGFGGLALALAVRVWHATAATLVLTRAGLHERGGRQLVRLQDIGGVNRGPFAFKPSNGFLITLKKPGTRIWAPGLWWRFGRLLG
ncbi:MAG: hypothetical protein U1D35_16570, partial [Paracoccaceae bacterium]|nr:hypothetical protein [Paracoccaceae bacterium]